MNLVPWRDREKWWQKLSGITVAPLCALLTLDSVAPPQEALSFPVLSACQETGRQSGWRELSGVTHQPHAWEHLPSPSVSTEQGAEGKETQPQPGQHAEDAECLPLSPASPAAPVQAVSFRSLFLLPPTFGSLFLSRNRAGRVRHLDFTVAFKAPPFPSSQSMLLPRAFSHVKLLVKSNWGNPWYTCIYRVQVHGKMENRKAPAEGQDK